MTEPAREHESPLTRSELYGWLARMYRRHEDEQAKAEEQHECNDSTASE